MKRIQKTFQGNLPENTVVNTQSDSQTNAYSCDYVNNNKLSTTEFNTYKNNSRMSMTQLNSSTIVVNSSNRTKTLTLSQSVANFDIVYVVVMEDWNHIVTLTFLKGLTGWNQAVNAGSDNNTYYTRAYVGFTSNTVLSATHESGQGMEVLRVFGVNFR